MPAAQPAYSRNNVLVGMANIFVQPYSSSSPATLPADTVAINTAWTSPWVPIGATDQGATLNFQRKTTDIRVEEQQTPVQILSDSTDVAVEFDLAEDTLQTLLWAFGGGTITQITGPPAIATLAISSNLSQFALGLEGTSPAGFFRRMLFQPCVSAGKVSAKYRRAAGKRMYTTSFQYMDKLENINIREQNA